MTGAVQEKRAGFYERRDRESEKGSDLLCESSGNAKSYAVGQVRSHSRASVSTLATRLTWSLLWWISALDHCSGKRGR